MFIKFLLSLFLYSVQIYGHNLFTTLPIFPKQQQQQPREREGGARFTPPKTGQRSVANQSSRRAGGGGGGGGGQEGEGAGRVKAKVKKWQVEDKR